jgi:hypothetical protein
VSDGVNLLAWHRGTTTPSGSPFTRTVIDASTPSRWSSVRRRCSTKTPPVRDMGGAMNTAALRVDAAVAAEIASAYLDAPSGPGADCRGGLRPARDGD